MAQTLDEFRNELAPLLRHLGFTAKRSEYGSMDSGCALYASGDLELSLQVDRGDCGVLVRRKHEKWYQLSLLKGLFGTPWDVDRGMTFEDQRVVLSEIIGGLRAQLGADERIYEETAVRLEELSRIRVREMFRDTLFGKIVQGNRAWAVRWLNERKGEVE